MLGKNLLCPCRRSNSTARGRDPLGSLWHSSRSQRPEQRNDKLCHVEWTLRGPNVQIFDIKCMPTSATTSALPNLVTYPDPHRRRANEMAAAMDAVGVDGEMLVSSIGARPQ